MKKVILTSANELVSVTPGSMVCVEADGNYSELTLVDGTKLTFCINLQHFGQTLVDQLQSEAMMFMRIGKSLIINRTMVFRINPAKQQLVLATPMMDHKFSLTASKEALRQVKKLIEEEL